MPNRCEFHLIGCSFVVTIALSFLEFCFGHSQVTWKQLDPSGFTFKRYLAGPEQPLEEDWLLLLCAPPSDSDCWEYIPFLTCGSPSDYASAPSGCFPSSGFPPGQVQAHLCSSPFHCSPCSTLACGNCQLHVLDPERPVASAWVPPPCVLFQQPGNTPGGELWQWEGSLVCFLVREHFPVLPDVQCLKTAGSSNCLGVLVV